MTKNNHSSPRVFVFIDSQNLNMGTQKAGWKMDWRKFYNFLQQKYNVSRVYLFIGYVPEYEEMYNQLHDIGYLIVLKKTLEVSSKSNNDKQHDEIKNNERKLIKGNIDVDLVLYVLKEMPNYEKAIIVSGDGDFYSLIEYLEGKKRLKSIMAPNWQYSSLLKDFEKYIVRLDQHRKQLEYKKRRLIKTPKS